MRLQARPFMVEIKNRRRATQPAMATSFARRDEWLDLIPPDDLPERDVREDLLPAAAPNEALREAERVFGRPGVQPVPAQDEPRGVAPTESQVTAPRVLPDL